MEREPVGFEQQVQRLVEGGKLSAEEAARLLEDEEVLQGGAEAAGEDAAPGAPALVLRVTGFHLSVVHDADVTEPALDSSHPGELELRTVAGGLEVRRASGLGGDHTHTVRALLRLPALPGNVHAAIMGGNLSLPELQGELRAEIKGGNLRAGAVSRLSADVMGGNLAVGPVGTLARLSVKGGNAQVEHSAALRAEVLGGNLQWAGRLTEGEHAVSVRGGGAELTLDRGSDLRLELRCVVGKIQTDEGLARGMGAGAALLRCDVTAGRLHLRRGPA